MFRGIVSRGSCLVCAARRVTGNRGTPVGRTRSRAHTRQEPDAALHVLHGKHESAAGHADLGITHIGIDAPIGRAEMRDLKRLPGFARRALGRWARPTG